MCLIAVAHQASPRYRLVVAANRDEFHQRPTREARFWGVYPSLLAGKDLEGGGTWMGVSRDGRVAAITNFREPGKSRSDAVSRGLLVRDFLTGNAGPLDYVQQVTLEEQEFNGFSLLAFQGEELAWISNRHPGAGALAPGIYGLSNAVLDTPWPKVCRLKDRLETLVSRDEPLDAESVFAALADRVTPDDADLPETGVGLERERVLSPVFIDTPQYGTRCSTLVTIDYDGRLTFIERSYGPAAAPLGEVRFDFRIESQREATP
ncbi:hypothetical protein ABI59_18500 [Acidobacteria bacterium Mor1]|nr:hypothetical protein ABI59_18500 [Acidobacteria bacterium Mor1]